MRQLRDDAGRDRNDHAQPDRVDQHGEEDEGQREAAGCGVSFTALLALSRSTNFWILPVEVLGSSVKTTVRGTLKRARCCAAMRDHLLGGDVLVPGAQFDKGAGRLAPFFVRPGHHGGEQHGGMLGQRILHFDGGNVLAAGNDDVLGAVLELDIAVRMHHAQIAGMKPAALEGGPRRLRVLQIALHHDIAAEHHFAQRSPSAAPASWSSGSSTASASSA